MSRTKICSKCKQDKELSCYTNDKNRKDGLSQYCKECKYKISKGAIKRWYEANKDRVNKRAMDWQKANPDKVKAAQERWRNKNRGYQQVWYQENAEKYNARKRERYQNNKDRKRAYYQQNRERIYERNRNRIKSDPLYKLCLSLRRRTAFAFKRIRLGKPAKTIDILGADIATVKLHIEQQFKAGMTWQNHGKWHIDHRTPLASATTGAELTALFHYTNLQPLWAADNISKGTKLIY